MKQKINMNNDLFIESIQNEGNFHGDYDMAAESILLQKNIIIYSNTQNVYKFLSKYTSTIIYPYYPLLKKENP